MGEEGGGFTCCLACDADRLHELVVLPLRSGPSILAGAVVVEVLRKRRVV